jgi:hypothetical protein
MRRLYIYFAFVTSVCQAQIVNIPDPIFKAKLLAYSPTIDTDGDGEIQQSEAALVISLTLYNSDFNNIIGIQSFTSLENLGLGSNCTIATAVDLSGMASLKYLNINKAAMPSVNLAGLTGLEHLSIGYSTVPLLNAQDAVNLKSYSLFVTSYDTLDLSPYPELVTLTSQQTSIDTVNLEGLSNLVSLKLTNVGDLTSIDLSDLSSLKLFELDGASLSELDFHNNIQLEEINTSGNSFTTLDLSMLPNLKKLFCHSGALTLLDISNNVNLEKLYIPGNQLTSIDLTNLHKLQLAGLSGNLFTSLDFSGQTELTTETTEFQFKDNPNLVSVNLKNGKYEFADMDTFNCPNLAYICVDEPNMQDWQYYMVQLGINTIQFNTYCSFVPGGDFNTITGTVSLDDDNDGCDASDFHFRNLKLTLTAEGESGTTYSHQDGNYNFFTQAGEFVVTPHIDNAFFTISPASAIVNFADAENNTEVQNFCLSPNGIHKDLEVTLVSVLPARPGFDATYRIAYKNKGTHVLSGNVDLTYDDSVLDLINANPVIASQFSNQLRWDYSDLLPFEKREIDFTLNVSSPTETPGVNNGDVLSFSVSISPANDDETPADNSFPLEQTVVGSYDPNDKICLEGTTMTTEMVGNYLNYAIRFQNSGTAPAENIVVRDLIDITKFDMDSFQLISASHPNVTRITGNKVEFIFQNISLPTQENDETGSQGYVAFKIKSMDDLVLGDAVSNTADIFFDFNFPITTNEARTTVTMLGLNEFQNNSISVSPNPVKNILNILAKNNITSIQLFDIQGRLLQTKLENNTISSLDLTGKTSGIYFVKVFTDNGMKVQKIIKE